MESTQLKTFVVTSMQFPFLGASPFHCHCPPSPARRHLTALYHLRVLSAAPISYEGTWGSTFQILQTKWPIPLPGIWNFEIGATQPRFNARNVR